MGEVVQAIHGAGAVCLTSQTQDTAELGAINNVCLGTKTEIKPRTRRIKGLMAHERLSDVNLKHPGWVFDIGTWKREQLASAKIKRANRGVITVTGLG